MAEAGIGQQRSFVKNLNRQTAQQIRESATATVKAMNEQVRFWVPAGGFRGCFEAVAARIRNISSWMGRILSLAGCSLAQRVCVRRCVNVLLCLLH